MCEPWLTSLSLLGSSLLYFLQHPQYLFLPSVAPSPDLLYTLTLVFIMSCLFCWSMSLLSGNLSQVDRLWSILPVIYSWIITFHSHRASNLYTTNVLSFISGIITVWGVRLSFNFYRRGGYELEGEDYRWKYVRKCFTSPGTLHVFNLVFIVIYQNLLLLLLVAPVYLISVSGDLDFVYTDFLLVLAFLQLVFIETVADQQQWNFQKKKHATISYGAVRTGDVKAGFLRSGLFRFCRHPNYLAEVLLWWVLAGFTLSRCGANWSLVGAANLTCLFTGSVHLTEQISETKYPLYKEYKKAVWSFIPPLSIIDVRGFVERKRD